MNPNDLAMSASVVVIPDLANRSWASKATVARLLSSCLRLFLCFTILISSGPLPLAEAEGGQVAVCLTKADQDAWPVDASLGEVDQGVSTSTRRVSPTLSDSASADPVEPMAAMAKPSVGPNSLTDYDWDNTRYVQSDGDDWSAKARMASTPQHPIKVALQPIAEAALPNVDLAQPASSDGAGSSKVDLSRLSKTSTLPTPLKQQRGDMAHLSGDRGSALRPQAQPPVAPNLTIAVSGTDVVLTWTGDPANRAYEVHRSTMPFFTPDSGTLLASLPAGTTGYTDIGAAGDVVIHYFYRVRALSNGLSTDSHEAGEIDYPFNNAGGLYSLVAVPFSTTIITDATYIGDVGAVLKWNTSTQVFRFFVPQPRAITSR